MELSFSSRVMAQCVNAVVSEVPMPQFTATLSGISVPPDVTVPEITYLLMMLYGWTISSEWCMLLSFCCCILYAHMG